MDTKFQVVFTFIIIFAFSVKNGKSVVTVFCILYQFEVDFFIDYDVVIQNQPSHKILHAYVENIDFINEIQNDVSEVLYLKSPVVQFFPL